MAELQLLKLCEHAGKKGASDLHLVGGKQPAIRVNGKLNPVETVELDKAQLHSLKTQLFATSGGSERYETELVETGHVDISFTLDQQSYRANVMLENSGPAITLRLVSQAIPKPEQIGFSPDLLPSLASRKGLFLVTGATGSGKSTTLASFIEWFNEHKPWRICTVEQPVEYVFSRSGQAIVTQAEVPIHTRTFKHALSGILRHDPDIIMVGELRNEEEMEMALQAAESGHIVFSTIHTNSAAETMTRIEGMFPQERQNHVRHLLSNALLGVVSQQLLPRKGDEGRVLSYELLLSNPAVANGIREGKSQPIKHAITTGSKAGMVEFDNYLFGLFLRDQIAVETAITAARDQQAMARRIQQRNVGNG